MNGISSMLVVAACAAGALGATIGNTTLQDDAWWGPASTNGTNDTSIRNFTIEFSDDVPDGVEVVPLLLLHGWPGSVREFYEAIPLLTAVSDDRDFALEVIVPSLPGFGFSDAAVRPELGATEAAVIFRNLMHRLGFKKFYLQGGDWGSMIGTNLATLFPQEVLGFHSNFPLSQNSNSFLSWFLGSYYPSLVVEPSVEDRMYPISSKLKFLMSEMSYLHIQASKPDTIGIVLSDSPSGLLAYILQLMSTGTRAAYVNSTDGGLTNHFTKAQLIDNLMMYWTTNSITTSCRIYAETINVRTRALGVNELPTPVLTWTLHAKDEIFYQSPYLLKFKFPYLVESTILETGGHFIALELPEIFAEDVLKAITAFRKIHSESDTQHTEL